MAAYVVINRGFLIGSAITGTAPGPGVTTPAGTISGTTADLTPYIVGGAEPAWTVNMVDATNMGSKAFSVVLPGITSGDDLQVDANSDEAASQLAALIRTVVPNMTSRAGDAPFYVDIRPNNTAGRSATNPSLLGAVYAKHWGRTGAVGARAAASWTLGFTGTFIELTS